MFNGCKFLSDIKLLELWNISNGYNFSYMFNSCKTLSNINSLEKWNISFKNWNVSNSTNFHIYSVNAHH